MTHGSSEKDGSRAQSEEKKIKDWCEKHASDLSVEWNGDIIKYLVPSQSTKLVMLIFLDKNVSTATTSLTTMFTDKTVQKQKLSDLYSSIVSFQDKLLLNYAKYFGDCTPDQAGQWKKADGTVEFCKVIDKCTKMLYAAAPPPDIDTMFQLVCCVCWLRMLHGISATTNLADKDSWTQWVSDNQVIVSFLVLCSVMMNKKKCNLTKPWEFCISI